jgi:transposase InsO family protein
VPISSITANSCTLALLSGWISCSGVPISFTSNRGAQFMSAVWAALCCQLHIRNSLTTAYHPLSNGLMKWFHHQF